MTWEYKLDGSWMWPPVFERKSHLKADKSGEMAGVFDDLELAKKVWTSLDLPPFPMKKGDKEMMGEWTKAAEVYYKSSGIKKLSGSLKVISTRIDKLLKTSLGKEAKTACKEISTEINICVDDIDYSTVSPLIEDYAKKSVEADKNFTLPQLKMLYGMFKKVALKKHPQIAEAAKELKAWPEDPVLQAKTAASACVLLTRDARDMTQNLKNVIKAMDYGGDLGGLQDRDKITIPKLNASLAAMANDKGQISDGKSLEDLVRLIRTQKVHADLFDDIASRLPG